MCSVLPSLSFFFFGGKQHPNLHHVLGNKPERRALKCQVMQGPPATKIYTFGITLQRNDDQICTDRKILKIYTPCREMKMSNLPTTGLIENIYMIGSSPYLFLYKPKAFIGNKNLYDGYSIAQL